MYAPAPRERRRPQAAAVSSVSHHYEQLRRATCGSTVRAPRAVLAGQPTGAARRRSALPGGPTCRPGAKPVGKAALGQHRGRMGARCAQAGNEAPAATTGAHGPIARTAASDGQYAINSST